MWAILAVTQDRMGWGIDMCELLKHAGALCIKRGWEGSLGVLPDVYLREKQLRNQEIGVLLGYREPVLVLAQE